MKKLFLLAVVAIMGLGTVFGTPVDVNTAKSLGQKFFQTKFEMTRDLDFQLYYTVTSDNGAPCAYVFNLGNEGFVIVAASDNVRPILGYSNEGPFDANNPYNGVMYMLETYKNSISHAIENNIAATPEIADEWEMLRDYGRLTNKRSVGEFLVQTKWDQNSPYNLYAPPTQGGHAGAGGRCYAGCVATAMGQLMKFWNYPITGEGQHGYNCVGYSPTYYNYGYQYADFGATTYQWDLMPLKLTNNSSQEEIEAVATLLYHCGVSVDMTFDWDGSGTTSQQVPPAMLQYFDYDYCQSIYRNSYTLNNWIAKLKEEFDLGRPVYYHGQSSTGGHAFVADGYDENDFVHFNFGWSGSSNGFLAVDAIEYNSSAGAIINFVPSSVYQNTLQAPTNLTATKTDDYAQQATLSWVNPTKTVTNQTISSINKIVVTRNDRVIYEEENVTPGQSMTFVDNDVPCYSTFEYQVYAVKDGVRGRAAKATESFGPTCQWKIIATTTNMTGWKTGYLVGYDGAGREFDRFTMTSSNPTTYNMNVPLGRVSFAWLPGTDNVYMTFKIKDSENNIVYQYDGTSNNLPSGVLYRANNGCGNDSITMVPSEIFATTDGGNIVLTWEEETKDILGVNVYRDGLLCGLVHENQFVDVSPAVGGHCYQICYLGDGGESAMSNEVCASGGEGCDAPYDAWYYLQNNLKPVITWEHPENPEGLSTYYIYRKTGEDGVYERIKLVSATKKEYKETRTLEPGTWYYYRVVAYYQDIDCCSAPAKAMYGNDYCVKFLYSLEGVDENAASDVNLYPNPTKDSFTVEAENIQHVMVYNTIGQLVYSQECEGNSAVINLGDMGTGFYMVKVVTANGESIQKVSVIR